MSVDFKAKVILGVTVNASLQDQINEATDYEYEDWFHIANHYDDEEYLIFGEVLDCIGAGAFIPFEPLSPRYTKKQKM